MSQDDFAERLRDLDEAIVGLKDEVSSLSSGMFVMTKKDLSDAIANVLDNRLHEDEKMQKIRTIHTTLLVIGCLGLALALGIVFLILFTEPI